MAVEIHKYLCQAVQSVMIFGRLTIGLEMFLWPAKLESTETSRMIRVFNERRVDVLTNVHHPYCQLGSKFPV